MENSARELVTRYKPLDDLNGKHIQVWVDKLSELMREIDGCVIVDEYGGVYIQYVTEETDSEYERRVSREKITRAQIEQQIQKLTKQLGELK